MAYKRRQPVFRTCKHCKAVFESNHKSRIYCSSSCNTLSWMKRTGYNSDMEEPEQTGEELSFSFGNIAVGAAGAAAYDAIKFIFGQEKGVTPSLGSVTPLKMSEIDDKLNFSLDLNRHILTLLVKDDPELASRIEEDLKKRMLNRNALQKIRKQKTIN